MADADQIGKFLVAGPAAYEIVGFTPTEIITRVRAGSAVVQGREVRWARTEARACLKDKSLRLSNTIPTAAEWEDQRRDRLERLLRKDALRKKLGQKGEASGSKYDKASEG